MKLLKSDSKCSRTIAAIDSSQVSSSGLRMANKLSIKIGTIVPSAGSSGTSQVLHLNQFLTDKPSKSSISNLR